MSYLLNHIDILLFEISAKLKAKVKKEAPKQNLKYFLQTDGTNKAKIIGGATVDTIRQSGPSLASMMTTHVDIPAVAKVASSTYDQIRGRKVNSKYDWTKLKGITNNIADISPGSGAITALNTGFHSLVNRAKHAKIAEKRKEIERQRNYESEPSYAY